MRSSINHVTVDCRDAFTLASWWAETLGRRTHPDDEPGDSEALVMTDVGPDLLFIEVAEERTVKNRVHLDLQPTDGTRDATMIDLQRRGATMLADHRRADGSGWVTMADPEGNEFCVERSLAERAG
jgi:predicted enzyme related to lactoylglutathione lyase